MFHLAFEPVQRPSCRVFFDRAKGITLSNGLNSQSRMYKDKP